MIRFGPWSTTLALGMAFGLLVSALLWQTRENRQANRLLAAAIVVIGLKLAPYAMGFAGFYDAYPWLSFLPVSFGLALGPLLYLHVARLTHAALPRRWRWHLLPALLQGVYYGVIFVQPLAFKDWWSNTYDAPLLDPAETALELASLSVYLWLAVRDYRRYQTWLDAHLSNREEFRLLWLRNVVFVLAAVVPLWAGFEIVGAWRHFDYFQRFPLYLGLMGWLLYLGLEGWRHAHCRYPVADARAAAVADGPTGAEPADDPGRWRDLGQAWQAALAGSDWWRDPELSLARLARHLGTNTSYVTRALNEGLGLSFHDVVNRLRVDEVKARLAQGPAGADFLAMAHDAGFRSKTSFNRLFKQYTGMTPTAFRRQAAKGVPTDEYSS